MAKYSDKSLMVKRNEKVPFWIRKSYHSILSILSKTKNKPMFFYVDEAIGDWLVKNNLMKK